MKCSGTHIHKLQLQRNPLAKFASLDMLCTQKTPRVDPARSCLTAIPITD